MTRHIDDSLLQDFREGLLDPKDAGEVREHLDACAQCREELAILTELLGDLGDLPVEAQPSRDLWPQIAWRMDGVKTQGSAPSDVEITGAAESREPRPVQSRTRRRFSLPAWQLAAASIALMVISGGTVWAFLSGKTGTGGPTGPVLQSSAQRVSW